MAHQQITIPLDSIRKKDSLLFVQVMRPFLTGEKDSTKIDNFQFERQLAAKQYSGNMATIVYTVANAFKTVLPPGDPALKDALSWMQFVSQIYTNDPIIKLKNELSE